MYPHEARSVAYDPDRHARVFGLAQHNVELVRVTAYVRNDEEPHSIASLGQCFECLALFDASRGFGVERLYLYPEQSLTLHFCDQCYRARRLRGLRMDYGWHRQVLDEEEQAALVAHAKEYSTTRAQVFASLLAK